MAAVIPEAAETVTSGEQAVSGAGARARQREAPRPPRDRNIRRNVRLPRARVPGNRQYQPVILAEFLVAVLVTAVAPLAQGGDKTAQAKGGPSPYSSDTLKQLVALGAAYFLLAILSGSRKYGRLAAWFGGLILLAVGLNSFVTGGITAIFGIFGPSSPVTTPDQFGQELQSAASAAQQAGQVYGSGVVPTPTGQPTQAQQVTSGTIEQQSITFTQPGVATTGGSSPGVTVT